LKCRPSKPGVEGSSPSGRATFLRILRIRQAPNPHGYALVDGRKFQSWFQNAVTLVLMTMHGLTPRERFMAYVELPDDPSQCWTWAGARTSTGWGKFRLHGGAGGTMTVGRASWILHNGPVPDGLHVCHRCDNGLCGNPTHLWLGTSVDNMLDKVSKGRGRLAGARHMSPTKSGTLAHIRINGTLHRRHFRRDTDPAVIRAWLDDVRRRYHRPCATR
jgi:hypothetical protein